MSTREELQNQRPIAEPKITQEQTYILLNNGWKEIPMNRNTHRGEKTEQFQVFTRREKRKENKLENIPNFSPIGFGGKDGKYYQIPNPLQTLGSRDSKVGCQIQPMGAQDSLLAPSTLLNPVYDIDLFGGSSILRNMRFDDDTFVIGFDSEFFYVGDERRILSWQFAFSCPDSLDVIEKVVVFPTSTELLNFEVFMGFIIENWGFYKFFGEDKTNGIPFHSIKKWDIPVESPDGSIKSKSVSSYAEALELCEFEDFKKALVSQGKDFKKVFKPVTDFDGTSYVPEILVDGVGVGFYYDFSDADKNAIPVALVSHYGRVDISTFFRGDGSIDLLQVCQDIHGGLSTTVPLNLHIVSLESYWKFHPVKLHVRDTMCYAPNGQRSLEDIGKALGVAKLDTVIDGVDYKSEMDKLIEIDVLKFTNYGVRDSIVVLLYVSKLWGIGKRLPITTTSATAKAVRIGLAGFYNIDTTKRGWATQLDKEWRGVKKVPVGMKSLGNGRFVPETEILPISHDAEILTNMSGKCLIGGFNACFTVGVFQDETYDYDVKNAYPVFQSLVPDAEYGLSVEVQKNLSAPLTIQNIPSPFELIFGIVKFEFPETVEFPCIPIRKEGCIIYPRTSGGESVPASAPELYLAILLGAKITADWLYTGRKRYLPDNPSQVSYSMAWIYKDFIETRSKAVDTYGKKSLYAQLVKQATNSIYGKTVQNVHRKRKYDAFNDEMVDMGESALTNPVSGCIATSATRAFLLASINQLSDLGYDVHSVTTDGFITNAPLNVLESLDLYGFTELVANARKFLDGDTTIWQVKHHQNDLLNICTRGNASLSPEGVIARNGYRTGFTPNSKEDREFFYKAVMTRKGKLPSKEMRGTTYKEMARPHGQLDFRMKNTIVNKSMDFDMKRKPLKEGISTVRKTFDDGTVGEIACLKTVPYESPEEFVEWKNYYKNSSINALRTEDDWEKFFIGVQGNIKGVHRTLKNLDFSKVKSCVMVHRLQIPLEGLGGEFLPIPYLDSDKTLKEKCEWLNTFHNSSNKSFTLDIWKHCGRKDRRNSILPEENFIEIYKEMLKW